MAIPAAYGFARFSEKRGVVAVVLVLCAMCMLLMLSAQTRKGAIVKFGEGARTALTYSEYQIPGTDVRAIDDRGLHIEGDVVATD